MTDQTVDEAVVNARIIECENVRVVQEQREARQDSQIAKQKADQDAFDMKKVRAKLPKPLDAEEKRIQKMRTALRSCGIKPDF